MTAASIQTPVQRGAGKELPTASVPVGADGVEKGTAANPIATSSGPATFATGTQTQVASSTAAGGVVVLAANTARKGATVYYDGAAILYLLEGAGTPTSTNYTLKMGNGFYTLYEAPAGFTGALKGIWSSAVGSANVTERTA